MSGDPIESLQVKVAYLDQANLELSDVVYRQQREIQILSARIETISRRLDAAQAQEVAGSPDQERPPHY